MRMRIGRLLCTKCAPRNISSGPVRRSIAEVEVIMEVGEGGRGKVEQELAGIVHETSFHLIDGDRDSRVFAEHSDHAFLAAAVQKDARHL